MLFSLLLILLLLNINCDIKYDIDLFLSDTLIVFFDIARNMDDNTFFNFDSYFGINLQIILLLMLPISSNFSSCLLFSLSLLLSSLCNFMRPCFIIVKIFSTNAASSQYGENSSFSNNKPNINCTSF